MPMTITKDAVVATLLDSFAHASWHDAPYRHWYLVSCLPHDAARAILDLPFPPPELGGISGKRELHNGTRKYFDVDNRARFPVCEAFSAAFQSPAVTRAIETTFPTSLADTYLRIEYAQDTDGFWLEPHSDLGVKLFTMLLYMSDDPRHKGLGTDIYDPDKRHVGRSPFQINTAMVFIPADHTFHGFERRRIEGVRKSIIINYVTDEWRAREQLAYPDQPIGR